MPLTGGYVRGVMSANLVDEWDVKLYTFTHAVGT